MGFEQLETNVTGGRRTELETGGQPNKLVNVIAPVVIGCILMLESTDTVFGVEWCSGSSKSTGCVWFEGKETMAGFNLPPRDVLEANLFVWVTHLSIVDGSTVSMDWRTFS